ELVLVARVGRAGRPKGGREADAHDFRGDDEFAIVVAAVPRPYRGGVRAHPHVRAARREAALARVRAVVVEARPKDVARSGDDAPGIVVHTALDDRRPGRGTAGDGALVDDRVVPFIPAEVRVGAGDGDVVERAEACLDRRERPRAGAALRFGAEA